MKLVLPNSQRLNRGNYVLSQLVSACKANDVTDLIILHEHRGEPGTINSIFYDKNYIMDLLLLTWKQGNIGL